MWTTQLYWKTPPKVIKMGTATLYDCYRKENELTLKVLQSLPGLPDLNCNLKTADENGHIFYLPFIIYVHSLSFHFLHQLSIDVFIIFIDSNELFICRSIELYSLHLLKVFSIMLSFLHMYFAIIFPSWRLNSLIFSLVSCLILAVNLITYGITKNPNFWPLPWGDILNWITWRPILNLPHGGRCIKGHGGRELFWSAFPHSCWQVHLYTFLLRYFLACRWANIFRILM